MIRVFVSDQCSPCQQIKEILARQQRDDVQVVDVATDEGYALFYEQVLAHSDGAIPSAYKEGQQCRILVNEEDNDLIFECPSSSPPE